MRAFLPVFAALLVSACALKTQPPPGEKLYFALEVRQEGRLIGKPKLLGEQGQWLRAIRRQPGAAVADYELRLKPMYVGGEYTLELDLSLPNASGHSQLSLLHGEEKRLELGKSEGDLSVSLLLMKVDSPEFRALMDLSGPSSRRERSSI